MGSETISCSVSAPAVFSLIFLMGSFTGPEISSPTCDNQYEAEDSRKTVCRHLEVSTCAAFSSPPLCPQKLAAFAAPDSHSISSPQRGHGAPAFHVPIPQLGHSLEAISWAIIALLSFPADVHCLGCFMYFVQVLFHFSGGNVNPILITPLAGVEVSYMFTCFYEQVQNHRQSWNILS